MSSNSSFIIDTLGRSSNNFDVIITGPPDSVPPYEAVPLRCYQQKDGNLLVEFQTSTVGCHKIEIFEGGRLIHGSPFHCQSYNPQAVAITQVSKNDDILVGRTIQIRADKARSGKSDLSAIVYSPDGQEIPAEV